MKVSIDGILGSAQKLNNQRTQDDQSKSSKKGAEKTDSIDITKRIDRRLDNIETDFKASQTSLTKNQTIKEGLQQMLQNADNEPKMKEIYDKTTFEGKAALKEAVKEPLNIDNLKDATNLIDRQINTDITQIKKLQVELDNIQAANLVDAKKVEDAMKNVDEIFGEINNISSISTLRPDAVMKLIK